jgi:UDP-N-acetylglucosamine transferase subunit ALG13
MPPERYFQLIQKADLVICHGGAGSLYHVFKSGKIPVVMPRRRKYGEALDDQFELVKAIAAEGRVIPAYEPEDLPGAIEEAKRRNTQPVPPPPSHMLELVGKAIEDLLSQRR